MKVTILGTGAYGLALSSVLHENHHSIVMWSKLSDEIAEFKKRRFNLKLYQYLIPADIVFTDDMKEAVLDSSLVVIAVPIAFLEDTVKELQSVYCGQSLCIATKGMSDGLFADEIVSKYIETDHLGIISGPSFAADIVKMFPIGLSVGSKNLETARLIQEVFENDHFQLRVTDDIRGVAFCGSIKNVFAMGAGMLKAMNFPKSSISLYITKCLDSIRECIQNEDTVLSFAGVGDLLLTCTSSKSRNFAFGYLIGDGADERDLKIYKCEHTIEGLSSLDSIHSRYRIPLVDLIYDIVNKKKNCEDLEKFLVSK